MDARLERMGLFGRWDGMAGVGMVWMGRMRPPRRYGSALAGGMALGCAMLGCANPGPPRPPSLYLPAAPAKVTALRVGDVVEVSFTAPTKTTDGVLLKSSSITGSLCRIGEQGKCLPVKEMPAQLSFAAKGADGAPNRVVWRDELPQAMAMGGPQAVGYRVTLYNAAGKSGEPSDTAYAVIGRPPEPVTGLRVDGSRAGAIVAWDAGGHGDVLIRREEVSPKDTKKKKGANAEEPGVVWLKPEGENTAGVHRMLDDSAELDVAYRYGAVRQSTVQAGGRTLQMRSAVSTPVEFTWREIYPPAAPTGLNAAGFATETGGYAVDLIWQPVSDTRLAGYNVYRETMGENAARVKLNDMPVAMPAFHDATAHAEQRYRYSVTAIDPKENESAAVSMVLEPR